METRKSCLHHLQCGQTIAHGKDIFSMSPAGRVGVYKNEHAFEHQVVTVREVQGLNLLGDPRLDHTW